MRPSEYTYIKAWGMLLGSYPYYIEGQQRQAAEDKAPADALYRRDDGTWFCRSELSGRCTNLRERLDRIGLRGGVE